jgi:hypothetical protein
VERLAALTPKSRKLLTAHNVPVSDPSYLAALRDATHAITSGTAQGTRDGALVTFTFEGFTIQIPASWRPSVRAIPSAH